MSPTTHNSRPAYRCPEAVVVEPQKLLPHPINIKALPIQGTTTLCLLKNVHGEYTIFHQGYHKLFLSGNCKSGCPKRTVFEPVVQTELHRTTVRFTIWYVGGASFRHSVDLSLNGIDRVFP